MHSLKITLASAAIVAALPTTALAECGDVSITVMDWPSAVVVTAVSSFIMTEGYGCTVTIVPTNNLPALTSIAETGRPDIVTELWVNSAPVYYQLEAEGKVRPLTDVLSDGGIEAWWIPKYLAEAHLELTSIEGVLANPGLVGNRLHNCPIGWTCARVNESIAQALDMEAHGIEVFDHGSSEALTTSIAAAYEDRAPWFGYYWEPTAVLGRYPMVAVDLGPYVPEIHECNADPDCEEVGVSAYPTARVITIATTAFAEREPAIADLMSKLSFTNARMGGLLDWKQANGASGEETAVHFLSTYPDEWSGWLNDEARQELARLFL